MSRARDLANGAANVFTANDNTKLDGIETAATADQTNTEIRTAVEAASDSNVFTDADHTKLNGIEASADVTDATNVAAAGAAMLTGANFTGSVGFNEASPDTPAHITKTINVAYTPTATTTNANNLLKLENPSSTAGVFAGVMFRTGSGADGGLNWVQGSGNDGSFTFTNQNSTDVEMMRIQSDGLIGIGTASPAVASGTGLQIHNAASGAQARLSITNNSTGSASSDGLQLVVENGGGALVEQRENQHLGFATNASERMRIDADGNLLVGKTSLEYDSTAGHIIRADGLHSLIRSGGNVADFNRLSSDGEVIRISKDGTTVGSIKAGNGDLLIGTGDVNLRFVDANPAVIPRTESDNTSTGVVDLGNISNRFKDGYFNGLDVRSSSQAQIGIGSTSASGALLLLDGDSNGDFSGADYSFIEHDTNGRLNIVQDSPSGINQLRFYTAATERMRLMTGALRIGQTTTDHPGSGNTLTGIGLRTNGDAFFSDADSDAIYGNRNNAGGVVSIALSGTAKGGISVSSSAVAFNTTSDRRLKSNIQDAASASDKIDALQVRQFDWNVDGSHQDFGLVAQELQPIAPTAVLGNADSDEMMSVDYSKLVPILIKEIQELRGRVAALEAA